MIVIYVIFAVAAYFLGTLPTAYLVTKKFTGEDIRTRGSGNVGATNAVRVLGRKLGIMVFAVDLLKGFIPALLGYLLQGPELGIISGALALIGHVYPVWLEFRGGKGVATGLGVAFALFPLYALIILLVWAVVLLLLDCVAVASCTATTALVPMLALGPQPLVYTIGFGLLAALIVYKHRGNFKALKS